MRRIFVFPGQGSQAVGMGRALAEAFASAREVFEEVDEALGERLSRLMWEGPKETLTLTENAQPAIMAVSLAAMRVIEREGGRSLPAMAAFAAGHSLGEYSALAAAGAFTLADTARLLRRRGLAMQAAVPVGAGGMAVLLGAERAQAESLIKAAAGGDVLAIANDNAPGNITISGAAAAIARASAMVKDHGIKRAMPVDVSAPFHSPLMKPAAEAMAEALDAVTIAPPSVPIIANVTAAAVVEPARIRELLVQQVTGEVRWREISLSLPGLEVDCAVEIGAGKTLRGMITRTVPEVAMLNVETPADIEAFLKTL